VRVDAQKSFTRRDKTCYVEDEILREMVQLHAIDKRKPTEKFMGKERKAAVKKG
jgi:hypothetical protein